MVALHIRSYDQMPPMRYLIRLDPETEPLHALLKRLRDEHGWSQYELAARVDPERANDPQAMRNLQTLLSRYETGKITRPDELLLEKLEAIYGLAPNDLVLAGAATARGRRRQETLFPVEDRDVEAVRQFSRYLQDAGERPGSPSFEERVIGYAQYLADRRNGSA